MSRRLVSYSDLTEDGAEAQQTSEAEAGPSTYTNGNAGDGRAKKRKLGSNGNQVKKRKGRGNGVHWDDPAYVGQMRREDGLAGGGYRDLVELKEVDSGERGSVGEDVDNRDDEMEDEGDDVEDNDGGEEGVYTGWKYDEWGEPYDGTQTCPEEPYEDEDEFDYDDEYEYDDDHSSSSSNAIPPFAIPDVDEFHQQYDPLTSPVFSTTPSTPHRPPHAVGGGGRTLTHTELYSPLSLVQTFNSALAQYCTLHALPAPRFTGSSESALWNDAPKHDSLLAQQVREDTLQVLAQRRSNGGGGPDHGGDGGGGRGKSQQQQAKSRGKPVVTVVPAVGLEGNAAWKKAIKTVETTPNRVGWIWPAVQTTPASGRAEKHAEAATSAKDVAENILANVNLTKSAAPPNEQSDLEKKLHHHWYAGYYAALAACGVSTTTPTPDASFPSQRLNHTTPTPTPTPHSKLEPVTTPTLPIDPPPTSMESPSAEPQ